MQLTSLFVLSFILAARACSDDSDEHAHGHAHVRREYPQTYLAPPTRPLVWGDLNFIHTTDTHGWLLGHQKGPFPEPNYRFAASGSLLRLSLTSITPLQWRLGGLLVFRSAHEGNCARQPFLQLAGL